MTAPVTMPPFPSIGTRVLIDRDGGPVPCEVIERDDLRGLVRVRMIQPGQPCDGLTFWRPWDAPVLEVLP